MINTIIIKSDYAECAALGESLMLISNEIKIEAKLKNVRDSIEYITTHAEPDIIFSDIHLSDGSSYEIFSQTGIIAPAVFIYQAENFRTLVSYNFGIDYISTPVKKDDLVRSLNKFSRLRAHFLTHFEKSALANIISLNGLKKRLVVRKGSESIAIPVEEIALIVTKNKMVFVIDQCSKKYRLDKTMNELENELPNWIFFRANRQYFVNINFIKSFRMFEHVKLQIDLNFNIMPVPIIVSQKTAPKFKKWIQEL